MERNRVRKMLVELEEIADKDYRAFEVALPILLRADLFDFDNYITDYDIKKLENITEEVSSLFDLETDDIDFIIRSDNNEI